MRDKKEIKREKMGGRDASVRWLLKGLKGARGLRVLLKIGTTFLRAYFDLPNSWVDGDRLEETAFSSSVRKKKKRK